MKITENEIPGLYTIDPYVIKDERGHFFESYRKDLFCEKIGPVNFIQENESHSIFGTLRGLHYQIPPFAQSKLVRVVKGKVFDVAIDLRKNSKTFGKYFSIILSSENKKQFFIPQGFAHGFVGLEKDSVLQYKVDNVYSKNHEQTILFDDNQLDINWPLENDDIIMSEKDLKGNSFQDSYHFE